MLVGATSNAAITLPELELAAKEVFPISPAFELRKQLSAAFGNPSLSQKFEDRKPFNLSKAERQLDTLYKNDKDYPIEVHIQIGSNSGCQSELYVNEILVGMSTRLLERVDAPECVIDATVPPGATYKAKMQQGELKGWVEWK